MKTVGVLIAVALALALQTTLAQLLVGGTAAIELVLVAVVAVALTTGPVGGMLAGSVAGLIQDSLSTGVLGIGGLAKSVIGFVAGAISQQFILTSALPRFLMFVGATIVHEACFQALYSLVDARPFRLVYSAVLAQALINGVIGVVAFMVVERGPEMLQRRRARSASLGRRHY